MIKKFEKNPRLSAIFYGAIGSLIAALILKFSPIIATWFTGTSFKFLIKFIDKCYANAATLEPINYSFYLLTILFGIFIFIWFEIIGLANRKIFDNDIIIKSKEKNISIYEKIIVFVIINLVIPLYMLYALLQIGGQVITLNSITNFRQHIRIIRPYINDNEYYYIMSEWSQMNSANDYNLIYKKIVNIANKEKLKLPKNRLY